jgi:hypothetical protein
MFLNCLHFCIGEDCCYCARPQEGPVFVGGAGIEGNLAENSRVSGSALSEVASATKSAYVITRQCVRDRHCPASAPRFRSPHVTHIGCVELANVRAESREIPNKIAENSVPRINSSKHLKSLVYRPLIYTRQIIGDLED